eukprot:gene23951-9521_t
MANDELKMSKEKKDGDTAYDLATEDEVRSALLSRMD